MDWFDSGRSSGIQKVSKTHKRKKLKMKVGIVGSREYENRRKIKDFIFKLKQEFGEDVTIVSGGCPYGADRYAKKYALELGLQYEEYPPFHRQHNLYCVLPESVYGKPYNVKYFFVRNKQIAKASDYVVSFIPNGVESNGSMDTIKQAEKLGKKTIIIDWFLFLYILIYVYKMEIGYGKYKTNICKIVKIIIWEI